MSHLKSRAGKALNLLQPLEALALQRSRALARREEEKRRREEGRGGAPKAK